MKRFIVRANDGSQLARVIRADGPGKARKEFARATGTCANHCTAILDPEQPPTFGFGTRGREKRQRENRLPYPSGRAKPTREQQRKAARNQLVAMGDRILFALRAEFAHPGCEVTIGATTSDQPLIRIARPDGAVYHVTVAKARK